MPTYRLDLAYLGTGFHGYAIQAGLRTVQGDLEAALRTIAGVDSTEVAGRTDRGVHASGQVVSFERDAPLDTVRLAASLNAMLGPEIAVLDAAEAPAGFHARFSATARRYEYRILRRPAPDPFLHPVTWHLTHPLDFGAMGAAAGHFVGEHDFASFCRRAGESPTVRRVHHSAWLAEGGVLTYRVSASSFCHQMVRSLVAVCVEAGRGRLDPASVPGIIAARDRGAARGAAPPEGLSLVGVAYGEDPLVPREWSERTS